MTIILSCSDREAQNFGIFLREVYTLVNRWQVQRHMHCMPCAHGALPDVPLASQAKERPEMPNLGLVPCIVVMIMMVPDVIVKPLLASSTAHIPSMRSGAYQ